MHAHAGNCASPIVTVTVFRFASRKPLRLIADARNGLCAALPRLRAGAFASSFTLAAAFRSGRST